MSQASAASDSFAETESAFQYNHKTRWSIRTSNAIAILCCIPVLAAAVAARAQDEGWQFVVQPYVLLPAMDGSAGVRRFDADVDISRRDVIDNLNAGYLGYVEASKGRWAFAVDVNYMNVDGSPDLPRIQADVSQQAVQPMVFYRLNDSVEFMGGLRYNSIELELSTSLQIANGIRRKRDWVDPILGLRYARPLGERSSISVLSNVGGFGLSSDIAFQLRPMLHYRVGQSTSIDAGYQFFYMDYEDGSDDTRFAYDVWTTGPIIGMTFRF